MSSNEMRGREAFRTAMTRGPIPWINQSALRRAITRMLLTLCMILPAIRARDLVDILLATIAIVIFGLVEFNLGFITGHLFSFHPPEPAEQPTFIIKQITLRGGEKNDRRTNKRTDTNGGSNQRSSSGGKRQRRTRIVDNDTEPGTHNTD